ncbi:hypothetical protein [Streptomyces cyaneofuscatus]|uniref:hypothetical protein n=1 Tax=Streptomyces cyaneofuscatus TaxID=66883 RepID=UPI003652DDCF
MVVMPFESRRSVSAQNRRTVAVLSLASTRLPRLRTGGVDVLHSTLTEGPVQLAFSRLSVPAGMVDRVMRRPTPLRVDDRKGGRPPRHGGEFVFGNPST